MERRAGRLLLKVSANRHVASNEGRATAAPNTARMALSAATEIPPLTDLLTVIGGGGLVAGAFIGFLLPAPTSRDLVNNVVAGSALGFVAGTILAFVVGIVDVIAGGA